MTTVYFDGLCEPCALQVERYRGMKGAENLRFIDIASPEFDAHRKGLEPRRMHAELRARDENGRLYVGIDALVEIWRHLAALRWLGPVVATRPARWLVEGGYFCFARLRAGALAGENGSNHVK